MAGKLGKREKKQGANGRRYLIITARPMPFHAKNQGTAPQTPVKFPDREPSDLPWDLQVPEHPAVVGTGQEES